MLKINDPKSDCRGSPYLISSCHQIRNSFFLSSFYVEETELIYIKAETKAGQPFTLDFNNNTVQTVEVHNHLGLSLDKKLDFNIHVENKINKCSTIIGVMKR